MANDAIPIASMLIEATDGGSLAKLATAVAAFANKPQKIKLGMDFQNFDPSKMAMFFSGIHRTVNSGIKAQGNLLKLDKDAFAQALVDPKKATDSFTKNIVAAMAASAISPQMKSAIHDMAARVSANYFADLQQSMAKDASKAQAAIAKNMAIVLKHGTPLQAAQSSLPLAAAKVSSAGADPYKAEAVNRDIVAKMIMDQHKVLVDQGKSQRVAFNLAKSDAIRFVKNNVSGVADPDSFVRNAANPVRRAIRAQELSAIKSKESSRNSASDRLDRGGDLDRNYGNKATKAQQDYNELLGGVHTPEQGREAYSQLVGAKRKILRDFVVALNKDMKASGRSSLDAAEKALKSGSDFADKHSVPHAVRASAFSEVRVKQDKAKAAANKAEDDRVAAQSKSVAGDAAPFPAADPSVVAARQATQDKKEQEAKEAKDAKSRNQQQNRRLDALKKGPLKERFEALRERNLLPKDLLDESVLLRNQIVGEIDQAVPNTGDAEANKNLKSQLMGRLQKLSGKYTDSSHQMDPEAAQAMTARILERVTGGPTAQRSSSSDINASLDRAVEDRLAHKSFLEEKIAKDPNGPKSSTNNTELQKTIGHLGQLKSAKKELLLLDKEEEKVNKRLKDDKYGSWGFGPLRRKQDANSLSAIGDAKERIHNPQQASLESSHNLNFAAMNAAYGFQDFFQVLAQPGMGVSRAFLAAANNIGPALGVLSGTAVGANVAVGGLLAGMSILNLAFNQSDEKAKNDAESIDRLANALRSLTQASFDARGALRSVGSDPGVSGASSIIKNNLGIGSKGLGVSRAIQRQGIPARADTRGHWTDSVPFYGEGSYFGSSVAETFDTWFDKSVYRPSKSESEILKEAPLSLNQLTQKYKGLLYPADNRNLEGEEAKGSIRLTKIRRDREKATVQNSEFTKSGGMSEQIENRIVDLNSGIASSREVAKTAVNAPQRIIDNVSRIRDREKSIGPAAHGMFRESVFGAVGASKRDNVNSEIANAQLSEFNASVGSEIETLSGKIRSNDKSVEMAITSGADNAAELANSISIENQWMEKRLVLLKKEKEYLTEQANAASATASAMALVPDALMKLPGAARYVRESLFKDARAAERENVGGNFEHGVFGKKTGKQINFAEKAAELKKRLNESLEDENLDAPAIEAKKSKYRKDLISEAVSFAGQGGVGKTSIIDSASLYQRIQESLTSSPAIQIEERQVTLLQGILDELRQGRPVATSRIENALSGPGFDSGGYAGGGKKPSSRDVIPAMLRSGEAVVTPERQAEIAGSLGLNPFTLFGTSGANGLKMNRGKSFSEWSKFGQARGFDDGGLVGGMRFSSMLNPEFRKWQKQQDAMKSYQNRQMGKQEQEQDFADRKSKYSVQSGRLGLSGFYRNQGVIPGYRQPGGKTSGPGSSFPTTQEAWPNSFPVISDSGPEMTKPVLPGGSKIPGLRLTEHSANSMYASERARAAMDSAAGKQYSESAISKYRAMPGSMNQGVANRLELGKMERGGFSDKAMDAQSRMHAGSSSGVSAANKAQSDYLTRKGQTSARKDAFVTENAQKEQERQQKISAFKQQVQQQKDSFKQSAEKRVQDAKDAFLANKANPVPETDEQRAERESVKEASDVKMKGFLDKKNGTSFDKKQAYLDKRSAGWSKEEAQKFSEEESERAKNPVGPTSSTVRGATRTNSWMEKSKFGQRDDDSSGLSPEKKYKLEDLEAMQKDVPRYSVKGGDRGKRLSNDREDDRKTEAEHSSLAQKANLEKIDAWPSSIPKFAEDRMKGIGVNTGTGAMLKDAKRGKGYMNKEMDIDVPGKQKQKSFDDILDQRVVPQNLTGDQQASRGGSFSSGSEQGMSSALLKQAVDLLTKMVDVSGEHSKNIVDAVMDSGISIG